MMNKKIISLVLIIIVSIAGAIYYFKKQNEPVQVSADEYLQEAEKLLAEKKYSSALEQYKIAINTEPSNTEAYLKAAEILDMKKKYEEAVEILNNGLATASQIDELQYQIGSILLKTGDRKNAQKAFEAGFNANESNYKNAVSLVKVYSYNANNLEDAKKILERVETNEDEGIVQKNYYLALLSYENIDDGMSYAEKALEANKDGLDGDLKSLKDTYEKVKKASKDIMLTNTYVSYEIIKGELYGFAMPLLEKVIKENDEYYAAYMYKGICQREMGKVKEAIDSFSTATEVDPRQVKPWVYLAEVYAKDNNQQDAIEAYEEALTLDRKSEEVRYSYAQTLKHFQLYNQARLEYKELIEQKKSERKVDYKIELAFLDINYLEEYEEPIELLTEILSDKERFAKQEEEVQAQIYDGLGWAYYKQGKGKVALSKLNKAQDVYEYLPQNHYHLGVLYDDIKNYSKAKESLKRAIDLDTEGTVSQEANNVLEHMGENDEKNKSKSSS